MDTTAKKTATVNPTLRNLTNNDTKVLGKSLDKKREKAVPPTKFQTRTYKTLTSNWTPVNHKPSNQQIYKDRRELVCNWFELWTDSQRKRFLDLLFKHCNRHQLHFIWDWFDERVPLRHVDFSRLLPRFLTLYIFSFLDPRSLCRASKVCWNWKFIAEQDVLWQPKCLMRGWYLPYEPAHNEFGAWKWHYVACLKTLDLNVLSKESNQLYGSLGDGKKKKIKTKKGNNRLKPKFSSLVLESRPAWQPPDKKPKDLDLANKALLEEYDPNDPVVHPSLLIAHNKFGIAKPVAKSTPDFENIASKRRLKHRILSASAENNADWTTEGKDGKNYLLSEKLEIEKYEEKRLMELVHQPWEPPAPKRQLDFPRRPQVAGGGYPLPWQHNTSQVMSKSYPSQAHPRIVFISSRIPAADILVDAVMFGVIPIVYEYEGTTLESLMSRLDLCLQGRNAQSIGIFCHQELPWEIRLVLGNTITLDNLDQDDHVQFFETIANYVLPSEQGGHIDFFLPLAASEPGLEMLVQLNVLTGLSFSTPTGIIGNYNHINSEWLSSPEGVVPSSHYFCASKLNVWANTADQAQEACTKVKKTMSRYFEQKHQNIVEQLTGQVVFDAIGQVNITGIKDITETLVDGLVALGKQQNVKSPLEYLGKYLLNKAANEDPDPLSAKDPYADYVGTLTSTKRMKVPMTLTEQLELDETYEGSLPHSLGDEEDQEVAEITAHEQEYKDENDEPEVEEIADEAVDEEVGEPEDNQEEDLLNLNNNNNGSDDNENENDLNTNNNNNGDEPQNGSSSPRKPKKSGSPVHVKLPLETPRTSRSEMWNDTLRAYSSVGNATARSTVFEETKTPRRLTANELANSPEKRTLVAKEILASELLYMRTLGSVKKVFYLPLTNALSSNRGVLSTHNIQIIFSDILAIYELSKGLYSDLRSRVFDWGSHQCLGDIFIKFTTKLKAYVNFLNNYPTILMTIERSFEQVPLFRAFLKRHERTAETRMLSLAELFLMPTRRISELIKLLTWFINQTPKDHADRDDLELAVRTFVDLDELVRECRLRGERERELISIQNKILHSPCLLEANRFFIKQLDVAHLRPPSESIALELRCYQHIETLGLFLFNDALVVTRRTTKNFPFEREVEYNYRFEACAGLPRLRVEDIPDSKYVKNAFKMFTPKRSWTCAADSYDDKLNWVSLVENTVRAALSDV